MVEIQHCWVLGCAGIAPCITHSDPHETGECSTRTPKRHHSAVLQNTYQGFQLKHFSLG